ncbi:hypothetical protein B0H12DRAFT_277954 [Mycena haematopus]|nr:hypothetical protein B0H12DRAFT_277954 [Mycena haematopus]
MEWKAFRASDATQGQTQTYDQRKIRRPDLSSHSASRTARPHPTLGKSRRLAPREMRFHIQAMRTRGREWETRGLSCAHSPASPLGPGTSTSFVPRIQGDNGGNTGPQSKID